jgi:hypothetical protein
LSIMSTIITSIPMVMGIRIVIRTTDSKQLLFHL